MNLNALVFIALCTVIGAISGETLIGLAVGLGAVFASTLYENIREGPL